MLNDSKVTANIPAADLDRARRFYADSLGLVPESENPGGLIFRTTGGTLFFLYQTEYAGQAGHTIAQFHVDDVDGTAEGLRSRGVQFETFDMPGAVWDGDIMRDPEMGNAAWFKDSEGNTLCVDDASV